MAARNDTFARALRRRRLFHHHPERLFVVPMDHSVTDGSISAGPRLDRVVGELARTGVDAIVLHKGALRYLDWTCFAGTSLVVHLSASTARAPDPDAKYLVAGVEESLRLGADAVSVHVNLGSAEESRQIADLAAVSEACERWNLPLLAMMYPRGPMIKEPRDPALVEHAVTLALDLGADIVKTVPPDSPAAMRDITANCPIPVVVAGGPRRDTLPDVTSFVTEALDNGAAGVAMGRNIFQRTDPGAVARRVAALVHGRQEPTRPAGDGREARELTFPIGHMTRQGADA